MRSDARVWIVSVFVGLVSVAATLVFVSLLGDNGPDANGYLDAGTTVLVTLIVGFLLARRVGITDEDDRAKRSFAVQGLHKVSACLDTLSVILNDAIDDDASVFPTLDKRSKRPFEIIKEEMELLKACLVKIESSGSRVTPTILESLLEQRQSLYTAWSEYGGSALEPKHANDITEQIFKLKEDVFKLYYDVVSRSRN